MCVMFFLCMLRMSVHYVGYVCTFRMRVTCVCLYVSIACMYVCTLFCNECMCVCYVCMVCMYVEYVRMSGCLCMHVMQVCCDVVCYACTFLLCMNGTIGLSVR